MAPLATIEYIDHWHRIHQVSLSSTPDTLSWHWSSKGSYTASSCYTALFIGSTTAPFWRLIWCRTKFEPEKSQSGFLSIDCGLEDDDYSGRKGLSTGIVYVSDGAYVDSGENHRVAAEYTTSATDEQYLTLRSFPSGERNCYALPTEAGAKYFLRLEFFYGNYDGKNRLSTQFDLHLGSNYWDTYETGTQEVARRGGLRRVGELGTGLPGEHRRRHAVRERSGAEAARGFVLPARQRRAVYGHVLTVQPGDGP
uniref:Malectin-like domain-containing protein n=1 Tax=Aegilops tauschii TaxID=37682 RepID=M8CTC8_AEGTA